MKIEINAQPVFRFNLTKAQINLISYVAQSHYDSVCRESAGVGGFVHSWRNAIMFEESFKLSASSGQLDTMLKILEMSPFSGGLYEHIANDISKSFREAFHTANRELGRLSIIVE